MIKITVAHPAGCPYDVHTDVAFFEEWLRESVVADADARGAAAPSWARAEEPDADAPPVDAPPSAADSGCATAPGKPAGGWLAAIALAASLLVTRRRTWSR